jgi:hypothetical protein
MIMNWNNWLYADRLGEEKQTQKTQTNADRIRAMSDEELVDFLGEYKSCDICDEGCEACSYHGDCNKRLLDWLKQPAEGE